MLAVCRLRPRGPQEVRPHLFFVIIAHLLTFSLLPFSKSPDNPREVLFLFFSLFCSFVVTRDTTGEHFALQRQLSSDASSALPHARALHTSPAFHAHDLDPSRQTGRSIVPSSHGVQHDRLGTVANCPCSFRSQRITDTILLGIHAPPLVSPTRQIQLAARHLQRPAEYRSPQCRAKRALRPLRRRRAADRRDRPRSCTP